MNTPLEHYWQNFIDGSYCDGGAGRIDVINPSTGAKLAEHALADGADVNRAVEAARRVYLTGDIRDLRPVERGRMVQQMGQYLFKHSNEIARIISLEQGKPLFEAKFEVGLAARSFEYHGNQAATLEGSSVPLGKAYFDFTINEPYGVSAQIIPCHYPVYLAARSLSVGLATGNSCVVKTPEMTPLSSMCFARAAEAAGLPAGAVNILCGIGQDAGTALTTHANVNQIVFSGNVKTGLKIAAAAAQNIVPCVLELGGNSPTIVYEDADLDAFEKHGRLGCFWNAGQYCAAISRVIVHESRYDELVERAANIAKSLTVGPGIEGIEFGPYMGSMDSNAQCEKVENMILEAQAQGATLITGGHKMNRPGAFMQPTVLSNVSSHMRIAQEEVFGPVMTILRFHEEAEAFQIANDTPYSGVFGAVFTRSIERATRAAHTIRACHIVLNESVIGGVETPFGGGFGKSGYGRVKGRAALWDYVQTKNIIIPMG